VRAPLNGIIIHHGYVVAEWGETRKVDMTHSVSKTFLTTVVGLAWQKGLIHDITDKARDYMPFGRGPVRGAAQPVDHVGAPAAAVERLVGNTVGQA
jgi:CubicO group peptidase (beta-lactamase class C family)